MQASFSERYGYGDKPKERIIEDAPERVRNAFLSLVLDGFIYIDRDTRYHPATAILGAKALYEEITASLLLDRDEDYTDSWHCIDVLHSLIRYRVSWNEFYEIVEQIGSRIAKLEDSAADRAFLHDEQILGYSVYRDRVNTLFEKAGIGWRLGEDSILRLDTPKELEEGIEEVTKLLAVDYQPSLMHVDKALKYARDMKSLDPENATKEIVSAIEAFGNARWPEAHTLGDVVKEMRRAGFPSLLVSVIEKFYAFASSEPAVRHGKHQESRVSIADAEFCVFMGIALLRYLTAYMQVRQ